MKRQMLLTLAAALLLSLTGCGKPVAVTEPAPQPTESVTEESTMPTTEETAPVIQTTAPTEPAPLPEPAEDALVKVADYIPEIYQELPYATEQNFTGHRIYDFTSAYLRYGTVKKLQRVAEELSAQGLGLKIWDGFRPVSAQFKLWEILPDSTYVANPNVGYSSHSRGNTVDITLVDREGNELEMPTGFDDFSAKADRDYSDCSEIPAANALLLQNTMEKHGFSGYFGEWWHFADTQIYPVEESFDPVDAAWYYADCNEFISLRTGPSTSAEVITRIPVNGQFLVLEFHGDFALVDYQGRQGYVMRSYIRRVETLPEASLWAANCEEYISLRKTPGGSEVIAKIPAGGIMELRKWEEKYALVSYDGQEGYVLASYIKPAEEAYFAQNLNTVTPTAVYTYDGLLADMEALRVKYPDRVTLGSIGTSELGRDIPVLRIGNADAKHHVLLQGTIHGREHVTAWLLMAMADNWLSSDTEANTDMCWHIIPMSNPDGAVISQTGALNDTQAAIYRSENSTLDEAEYAALWKANGLGVDLNRNFPAGWEAIDGPEEPSSQRYRGEAPFSAAEAQALRDYTMAYAFGATISYHASGSVIYYEYGDKQPVNSDSRSLGQAVSAVTGYPLEGSGSVDGAGYKDWAIDTLEIPSLTIEVGSQEAPLAQRELYSVFARNRGVLTAIARWLESSL